MQKINIVDGTGNKFRAKVTNQHELLVTHSVNPTFPDIGSTNQLQYYSKLLGTTGSDSGTTNLNVDGSSTPVKFFIEAEQDFDIRIMNIVITITDGVINHNKFGGIPSALTNGWDLQVLEQGETTFIIEKAKSNGEILQKSGSLVFWGNGQSTNIIPNFSSANDALIVNIPISQYIPGGFRIGTNGVDKLQSVVNDDLTGLVSMTVRALGYKHFPPSSE